MHSWARSASCGHTPPVNPLTATPQRVGGAAGAAVKPRRAPLRWPLTREDLTRPELLIGAALVIVIGVGLMLRLHDIGVRSLWVDELFSVGLAAQQPRDIVTVIYGEEANMTLYYAFMYVWM